MNLDEWQLLSESEHPEQWVVIFAVTPGQQFGVRCLAQGQLSRGVEGGERAGYSLPPPTIPAGPETRVRLSNRGGVKAMTSP